MIQYTGEILHLGLCTCFLNRSVHLRIFARAQHAFDQNQLDSNWLSQSLRGEHSHS